MVCQRWGCVMRKTLRTHLEISSGKIHTHTWKISGDLEIYRTWKNPGPLEIYRAPGLFQVSWKFPGGYLNSHWTSSVKRRNTTETLPVICNQCTVVGASDPPSLAMTRLGGCVSCIQHLHCCRFKNGKENKTKTSSRDERADGTEFLDDSCDFTNCASGSSSNSTLSHSFGTTFPFSVAIHLHGP